MLARWKDGLPFEEHTAWLGRWPRWPFRAFIARVSSAVRAPPPANRVPREDPATAAARGGSSSAVRAGAACRRGQASRFRRAWGVQRRTAIPRDPVAPRNAVRDAPAGDLYHGMAFMGIPVALALGERDGVPVVYDARDIYLNAQPGPDGTARTLAPGRPRTRLGQAASRVITVNATPT